MNHRFVTLKALETGIAASAVKTIDLDMLDPISQILIWHCTVMSGSAGTTGHPMTNISKVEIIDGSDVLFSLDGEEMQALDIYHSGIYPRAGEFHYLNGLSADFQIAIDFGRYLWDEELAFDPKRFGNPQLRITYVGTLVGQAPSSCELRVNAAMFDEKAISPSGFLMTKEIKSWITASGSHEYTDCPTDFPYRKLFLQSRYASSDPRSIFNNIKLSSDQDKKVILNHNAWDILMGIGRENAYIEEMIQTASGTALRSAHCTPTAGVSAPACQFEVTLVDGDIATYHYGGGYLRSICAVACNIQMHVCGWAPHGCIQIPFGKQDDIADWFDVRQVGSLKLDVTSGDSSATQKLFIQQLRTY